MEPAPGLPPDAPEPSYLPRKSQGRTEIRLAGSEPLVVMEAKSEVKQQLQARWMLVTLYDGTEVEVNPVSVSALIDLEHPRGQETHLRSVRPDNAAA